MHDAGADAAEPGREQQPPKKQKRGSKSKAAQAEQLVAAGSSAETEQPAAKPSQAATSAAQDASDKKSQARAAKKQAKVAAGAEEAEIVGAAKVDKRGDKASKKRKTEEAAAAAANTSEHQADESMDDATMTHDEPAMTQGGGRARAGRTRASKAPYWMGGTADNDSAPAGDDSPTDESPGGADPEADSESEAPKPAAKKHKGQEPHQVGLTFLFFWHYYYCMFSFQRRGASADKLRVKAATSYPLVDSPDPSKTQSSMGIVLSVYTHPGQPGLFSGK